jgi:hypothetical protein
MSNITVVVQTQRIEITPSAPRIVFDPQTSSVEVTEAVSSVSVINAGPPGPAGPPGLVELDPSDLLEISETIDTKIGIHNQASPIHESATSGRDFVALFENGLI